MFKIGLLAAATALLAGGNISLGPLERGRPFRLGERKNTATMAARRHIDPDPSLSRQQRRYAERLAAKRAKYSDTVRRRYLIPLSA